MSRFRVGSARQHVERKFVADTRLRVIHLWVGPPPDLLLRIAFAYS